MLPNGMTLLHFMSDEPALIVISTIPFVLFCSVLMAAILWLNASQREQVFPQKKASAVFILVTTGVFSVICTVAIGFFELQNFTATAALLFAPFVGVFSVGIVHYFLKRTWIHLKNDAEAFSKHRDRILRLCFAALAAHLCVLFFASHISTFLRYVVDTPQRINTKMEVLQEEVRMEKNRKDMLHPISTHKSLVAKVGSLTHEQVLLENFMRQVSDKKRLFICPLSNFLLETTHENDVMFVTTSLNKINIGTGGESVIYPEVMSKKAGFITGEEITLQKEFEFTREQVLSLFKTCINEESKSISDLYRIQVF